MQVQEMLNFKVQKVAIRDMKPGPNVRKEFDPEAIATLGVSLKLQQLQPLVLAPDLMIIDGWRRWLAAQKAELEWLWAAITHRQLSPDERIAAQLAMALHRKDLTEQEKVAGFEELALACPELDQKRLAERLQIDATTACRWASVSPDRVIVEVRDAFFQGRIGLKATCPISQAPKVQQPELLQLALTGATREQLTMQVRRQRQPASEVRSSRIRCVLPQGGSVTVSGTALSVDDVIEHLTSLLREAKKAREQNLDVKTWERVMADKAKAVST